MIKNLISLLFLSSAYCHFAIISSTWNIKEYIGRIFSEEISRWLSCIKYVFQYRRRRYILLELGMAVKFYVALKPPICPPLLYADTSIKIVERINALLRAIVLVLAERGFNKVPVRSDSSSRSCRDNIPRFPSRRISPVIKSHVNITRTKWFFVFIGVHLSERGRHIGNQCFIAEKLKG